MHRGFWDVAVHQREFVATCAPTNVPEHVAFMHAGREMGKHSDVLWRCFGRHTGQRKKQKRQGGTRQMPFKRRLTVRRCCHSEVGEVGCAAATGILFSGALTPSLGRQQTV